MSTTQEMNLKDVRNHIKTVMNSGLSANLIYHNWTNTKINVDTIKLLSKKNDITNQDKTIALIATYFLYTGFTDNETTDAYLESKKIAHTYLTEEGYPSAIINSVDHCLSIKQEDITPDSVAGRLFHDMLYAHYGQKKIKSKINKSLEERNLLRSDKKDLLTKYESELEKMKTHKYFTPTANRLYKYKKLKNIAKLQSEIDRDRKQNMLGSNKTAMTMFKTALRNHIDLISIADKKAGIMISINAIIMTLMIPILGSYIIDVSKFIIPSIILIITCGSAVILATLATRPKVADGTTSEESKLSGEKSLFHFENFFNMNKEDYQQAIKDVIVRENTLENSIINDLYDMGYVLGIKYKKLSWCYLVFAAGITLTIISFILSFFFFPEI